MHASDDEIRRLIESLRRSEARLDETERIAHVGYWDRDLVAGTITLSDESARIFGLPSSHERIELAQWHDRWLRLIHPDDRPRIAESAAAALRGGARYDVEYRVLRSAADVRIVHSRAEVAWDGSGRPLRMFGVMQDITALRQAERELSASEARFRTFVDHAMDAFFLHDDATLAVADVNRQACASLGYAREELIGMHPRDFDVGLDDAALASLAESVGSGETVTFESLHRRKDGTVFPVEIRAARFEQGARRWRLSLARDITDRKRAEQEREKLRQAQADLARISRVTTMGELTASLAHELKQPIAAAITNANACVRWLARDRPDLEEAREAAARIVQDATRAAQIIDRLRSLYRKDVPPREPVDVNGVVRDTLALLRGEASRHAVSLRADLAPDLPAVEGDRVQLQQVILNLTLNGIEAMSERGGVVTVESRQGSAPEVLIAVSDEGLGLPDGNAEGLFEAFFTTKPQGTGMGLTISRSIVEAHGGRLWATPRDGRGATFLVALPAAQAKAGGSA